MTDELPGETLHDDALRALLDRPFTELTVDELMALKDAYAARGIQIVNSVPWEVVAPLGVATGIYAKAFLETLAKHNAESLIKFLGSRSQKRGKTIAFLTHADGDAVVKFLVKGDLPDKARRALLDPAVIAEALCGKILQWDSASSAWHPSVED